MLHPTHTYPYYSSSQPLLPALPPLTLHSFDSSPYSLSLAGPLPDPDLSTHLDTNHIAPRSQGHNPVLLPRGDVPEPVIRHHPNMENRHSSPYSRASSPRPGSQRNRSNSFPLVDALGCSTPEAKLLLAEGRAAIRSRHASAHRQGRRNRSTDDDTWPFRPQDHIKYLEQHRDVDEEAVEESTTTPPTNTHHIRIPSNATDRSSSTVTALAPPRDPMKSPQLSPTTPLGDYSANLAKFIQSQLNSIATFNAASHPRSCPDLTPQPRTPPLSPVVIARRHAVAPSLIEIPAVRPPLRSAFSQWSSTDDENDEDSDTSPTLPSSVRRSRGFKQGHYTPSIIKYYEDTNDASFLFTSTPLEEETRQGDHPNAEGFSFPTQATQPPAPTQASNPPPNDYETDYPSSALSSRPQLTTSSAPSFSSDSTASYFDCKRPISFAPHVRDRIIAAVSPHGSNQKVLQATSPFEGGALASVHDILVESQHRVLVDGFSFDLVKNFQVPNAAARVTTPC